MTAGAELRDSQAVRPALEAGDAAEVRRRRAVHGTNAVTARSGPPVWLRFLKQFHQAVMYILLVAAGASFLLNEVVDGFVILTVVLINGIIGFTEFLIDEKPGPLKPKQKEYLLEISTQNRRMIFVSVNNRLDIV